MHTAALPRAVAAWLCYTCGSLVGLGPEPTTGVVVQATEEAPPAAPSGDSDGTLSMLTYNVAGLPDFISQVTPSRNHPLVSPLLRSYDLVLVQEDFAYHPLLTDAVEHAYRSVPKDEPGLGDGLNRFSRFPFFRLAREAWRECNGQVLRGCDCLASKGFSVARTVLARGVELDIYNLHFDSGRARGDMRARIRQARQLVDTIRTRSRGVAVMVAGDTNMRPDELALSSLLAGAGLKDACRELGCGVELIDRVLFRGSSALQLEPLAWQIDDRFVDERGRDLSDHKPVAVHFRWSRGDRLPPENLL